VPPWSGICSKLKEAHDKIESVYIQIETGVGKVKEHHALDTAVRMALPNIPIMGSYLLAWYNGVKGSEEDKTKEILEFLVSLQQQDEEQFTRISDDFRVNLDAIVNSKMEITELISKASTEILEELHRVGKDTTAIRKDTSETRRSVEEIKEIVKRKERTIEIRYAEKPSTFRGEQSIFIGRQTCIEIIKQKLKESNAPISIIGSGGIGKSALAFKAIHQCEVMFDLIIPIYLQSVMTITSFLSLIAKSLNLPLDEFNKQDVEERKQILIDTLGTDKLHPLIFLDNYETISGTLSNNPLLLSYNDPQQINSFLKRIPQNTSVILTSRQRNNLDRERRIELLGLGIEDGKKLFIKLIGDDQIDPPDKIIRIIEELVNKTGGHPLSIEILARSYSGDEDEFDVMLDNLGISKTNPQEEEERLRTLEACFEYSLNNLDDRLKELVPKLTIFRSPFLVSAASEIFEVSKIDIINFHNRSLLTKIESDEYGRIREQDYWLYTFHPALRNYLEYRISRSGVDLKRDYGNKFANYYQEFLRDEVLMNVGREARALPKRIFSIIMQESNNDFERSTILTDDHKLSGGILWLLGAILSNLDVLDKALLYYKRALDHSVKLNDKYDMGFDYRSIGRVLGEMGDLDKAMEYHKKALTIFEELNSRDQMSLCYGLIGSVFDKKDDLDKAMEYYEKALTNRIGALDWIYTEMGSVFDKKGDLDKAIEYYEKAIDSTGDKFSIAQSYYNIGTVHDKKGDLDKAMEYHKKALTIFEELDNKVWIARTYGNIGIVLKHIGNLKEAQESILKSFTILEEFEEKTGYHHPYRAQLEKIQKLL
jgi:tetratricopeptide (TPR) repeat protein